jgi:hypothetical protein
MMSLAPRTDSPCRRRLSSSAGLVTGADWSSGTLWAVLDAVRHLSPLARKELVAVMERLAGEAQLLPFLGAVDSGKSLPVATLPPSSQVLREVDWLLWKYRPTTATLSCDGSLTASASVNAPPSHLPIWASPQAVALAAWLTVLLTLIGVALAVEAAFQGAAPVNVVIVPPGNTRPTAP